VVGMNKMPVENRKEKAKPRQSRAKTSEARQRQAKLGKEDDKVSIRLPRHALDDGAWCIPNPKAIRDLILKFKVKICLKLCVTGASEKG
jgi:hypothetical protein